MDIICKAVITFCGCDFCFFVKNRNQQNQPHKVFVFYWDRTHDEQLSTAILGVIGLVFQTDAAAHHIAEVGGRLAEGRE